MTQARTNGQANGGVSARQGGMDGKTQMIQELTKAGVSEKHAQSVVNLLSEDFVLGNVRTTDREYARLLAENIALFVAEEYPPEESSMQGRRRGALLRDPSDTRAALTQKKKNELESILLATFFRTSRSEGGWQQDKIADQTQVKRLEDETREESESLMDKVFGE